MQKERIAMYEQGTRDTANRIHIGSIIKEELRSQERTVSWFARKLNCDRTNVYKLFRRSTIDTEQLLRISQILHRNLFLYYSERI